MNNLTACAYPCVDTDFRNGLPATTTVDPGLTKHEKAALMIAQGLVSKYNLKTPEDQQIIAQLSYELAAEILNQFK